MLSGFSAPAGLSCEAETRTERLPLAVSYSMMSRADGIEVEDSRVVKDAPPRIQRAGPNDFPANAGELKIRFNPSVSSSEADRNAGEALKIATVRKAAIRGCIVKSYSN